MLKCRNLTQGKITIEFTRECLMCTDEDQECGKYNKIDCTIHATEGGEIAVMPEGLMGLLVRLLSASCIINSAGTGMQEAYHQACHVSGFIAEEMEKFKEGAYQIKIHVPSHQPPAEA